MTDAPILVVGAGPTGLNLALQLARRGVGLRIIDRHEGPAGASRAVAVQARTLEFYDQLGISGDVLAGGVLIRSISVREGGEEVARLALDRMGEGLSPHTLVLGYAQDDHERLLVDHLQRLGVAIEWRTELRAMTQDAAAAVATLAGPEGEAIWRGAYIVGCDGAHSAVRQALGIEFPGRTNAQMFYVADVRLADDEADALRLSLDAAGLALTFPIRPDGSRRIIGIIPEDLTDAEAATFDAVRPTAERLLGVQVTAVNWYSTYRVHHRVAEAFGRGRGFIAGDAGHIHSPAGGQGMNTGIGDAVNLGWKLAAVLRGRADEAILDTYEPERIAFARQLVASTDAAFTEITSRGSGARLLRTLLPRAAGAMTRFTPVRRAAFRLLSQIRVRYPDSALSEGHAGGVRGGDRLPWVEGPDGGNFAPLRSLNWQGHVYGEIAPALVAQAERLELPLHAFGWSEGARRAGLRRDGFYLVRPDGYVGLANAEQTPETLATYAAQHGLRFGAAG